MSDASAARFRPAGLVAFSAAVALAACLAKPAQYDPFDPAAAGGAGGSPLGIGGGGVSGSGRGTGKDGPETSGTAGSGGFVCEAGAPCVVPGKPCIVGSTVCEGTSATCAATTALQANGSPCEGDSVCLDGVCSVCKAGLECPLDTPCRSGVIECGSGKPACTESGNTPNGTQCGTGMVCKEGACMACQAGDSCLPSNPCHEGKLDCAGGAASCADTDQAKPVGSRCGVNKVCGPAGQCIDCVAGTSCELPDQPCKAGKIECSSGASVCVASGSAQDGKVCGDGRVCREGNCDICANGMPCTPDNKCHVGTLSCSSGRPVCTDSGANARNGVQCGTNQFCSNGTCVACTPNMPCTPDNNQCQVGRTSCETGTSQCVRMGQQRDGTGCGSGQACQGGSCVSCGGQGQPCCGSSCSGGPSCSAGNVVSPVCENGICAERITDDCDPCEDCTGNRCVAKQCGSNSVCRAGSCVGCGGQGQPCCPGGSNGGCSGSAACSDGSVVAPFCDNGTCRERESQRCSSCEDCVGNRCMPRNCGSGHECRTGNCVEVVDNGRSCGASAVCKPGASCKNGVCCANGTKCLATGADCLTDNASPPYRSKDCSSGLCDPNLGGTGAVCVGGSNNGGGCIGPPVDPEQCGMPGTCRWTGKCAAPP